MNAKQLERTARDAHARGETWDYFWSQYGRYVIATEPYDRQRFHRLLQDLMALVISGNTDGQQPPDMACPWERDDQPAPADIGTTARLQLNLWPLETSTR